MYYTIFKENNKNTFYPVAKLHELFSIVDKGTKIAEVKISENTHFRKHKGIMWVENPTLLNIRNLWENSTLKDVIEAGADIHYNDDFLLRYSAMKKKDNIVKFLITIGANVHADNDFIIFNAGNQGNVVLLNFLKKYGICFKDNQDNMLQLAANNNQRVTMQFLIENGADIHCNNDWIYKNVKHEGTILFAETVYGYSSK